MRRFAAAITAAALLVVGSYAAAALTTDDEVDPPSGSAGPTAPVASPQLSELDRLITVFEQRVATNNDWLDFRRLGRHYFDRAWLTGNLSDYRNANRVLSRAIELSPGQPDAMRLLARSTLALHGFRPALDLTDSLLRTDPLDADALLIAADTNLELGQTGAAATALHTLTLLAPDNPALLVR